MQFLAGTVAVYREACRARVLSIERGEFGDKTTIQTLELNAKRHT